MAKIKVLLEKKNEFAVVPFKKHEEDFCYDVVATSREEIAPHVYKYGIGWAFELQRGGIFNEDYCIDIDLRPRSSVWETGMVLANCEGTIDELYRGEVCAIFYHVLPDMPIYEVGDKIGQIKLGVTSRFDFEVVAKLSDTSRGDKGFGSTGK